MVAFILVCLVLLLGLLWGWEIRKRKSLEQEFVKKKNEVCSVKEFSDTILYNVDAYIILVDRNFLVEKTNYYNLNNTSEGQVLRRVGELLRCKNGLDAGACGSHENCKVCPVRNSIEKCFREKGHFSPLETPMRLYMSEKMDNYVDCIVCVSGTYLQLDQDDKVLLTVRDVTRQKKILDELEEARQLRFKNDTYRNIRLFQTQSENTFQLTHNLINIHIGINKFQSTRLNLRHIQNIIYQL